MAMILNFLVSRYIASVTGAVEKEIFMLLRVNREFKNLQDRLEEIKGYIKDAEGRRNDSAVDSWVRQLKDIMYDADDIVDLCVIEAERRKEMEENQSSDSVVCFFLKLDSGFCFPFSYVSSCFQSVISRYNIASSIEKVNQKLKKLAEDNSKKLKLHKTTEEEPESYKIVSRETDNFQLERDVVGTQIENAAERLINSILKTDKKCSVFGIVGTGGIGKSTLASKIFNDARIKENFHIKKWLYISKNYTEMDLLKELIRGAGDKSQGSENKGENLDGKLSRDELYKKLDSLLTKNFFLVLDDVWSSNVWNLLKKPILKSVAKSVIIVTTRNRKVPESMTPEFSSNFKVDKMDDANGWKLLRSIVEAGDDNDISDLEGIGTEIVRKCDGLPLAIKAIAGVLKTKTSQREWEKVLESDAWNMNKIDEELPQALYLSYDDLPSHLKQCFLYCSLYPEKSDMYYKEILRFWVAEGLIVEETNKLMEEVAEEHYIELVCRNLLQVDPSYVDYKGYFSMHDHLRALGSNLMKEEGILIRNDKMSNTNLSPRIRRLSVTNMGTTLELPEQIMKEKCLRTLIVCNSPKTKIIKEDVFRMLPLVRVLDVTNTSIRTIPDSIGTLLHLRYLDLDSTNITELPESLGNLVNLQTLNMFMCRYLRKLPKAITKLKNLRCLDIEGCPLTHVPEGIEKLVNLNNFEGFLVGHDDPTNEGEKGCDLMELKRLSKLRCLSIYRLDKAVTGDSALAGKTNLSELTLSWGPFSADSNDDDADGENVEEGDGEEKEDGEDNDEDEDEEEEEEEEEEDGEEGEVDEVEANEEVEDDGGSEDEEVTTEAVEDGGGNEDEEVTEEEEDDGGNEDEDGAEWSEEQIKGAERICEELSRPPNLQDLTIRHFPGRRFPNWMMSNSIGKYMHELRYLKLRVFPNCEELPPLGLLRQLTFLNIEGASSIKTIGPQFLGPRSSRRSTPAFPKLEILQFYDMLNWEEWSLCEDVEADNGTQLKPFPKLKEFYLNNSPKLRALPEGLCDATNLKELYVQGAHALTEITNLPLLGELHVTDNQMLKKIWDLLAVKYLVVYNCPSVECMENVETLDHLVLVCPEKMKKIPQWLPAMIENHKDSEQWCFRKFEMQCNVSLLKSCLKDGENWPVIKQIPDVEIRTFSGKSFITYIKKTDNYAWKCPSKK
ncbi:disease resistance protein RGA3 [Canna indica]|uniref:Disease resistance protein RGA3 n=1 Tax=Canna indica TaxID=4628 RepID=A0AAQ3KH15_9LILI|nr:disease resistance protein RGA3 [Canna indica]